VYLQVGQLLDCVPPSTASEILAVEEQAHCAEEPVGLAGGLLVLEGLEARVGRLASWCAFAEERFCFYWGDYEGAAELCA
jgi:hypothetical protein